MKIIKLVFETGNHPTESGWYLVAVKTNDVEEKYCTIQLWFNPMANPKWWVGGGYVSNRAEPYRWAKSISAFCPMPVFKAPIKTIEP